MSPTRYRVRVLIAALACWIGVSSAAAQAGIRLPGPELNLNLTAPIKTWDEAVPLGNGAMGVLLWGETNLLRLSLDRGDLWDERPSPRFTEIREHFNWKTMQGLVASNRMAEFNAIFDSNYDYNGSPTKLPAGRLEITLDSSQCIEAFELNLATAEGVAKLTDGNQGRVFVNAARVQEPVAILRLSGPPLREVRLKSPDSVQKLGYPPPRAGAGEGLRWFEQEAADGFAYAICAAWKRTGNDTLLAVTVANPTEGTSPQAIGQARVEAALAHGYAALYPPHALWWSNFWSRSRVTIPEAHLRQHYHLVRYFYGAASRRGAPPMPLQGVWTADAGALPPWKGDYHNDLNTQMTYLAYRASGDFEEGVTFLDYLWDRLPTFRQFAKDFYSAPGAAVPGVMSLAGQALGGWGQYSLSPTMGAWNAHLFYLHWRHTGDERFLRERAYPFCREIAVCLESLLRPDTDGVLVLPLSSSPEIFDNTRRAFLQPNSNYDLASLKMLFLAVAEMAAATGDQAEAARWLGLDRQLGGWHVRPDGTLLLDKTTPLPASHRHLSNLMPLHPFNLITVDGGERDRQVITASLADWDQHGTSGWCGYSFSWMACLRARVGDAEAALRNLDIYARAFVLRNGFHANGDQTKSGFSSFTYRPFTLEGNFLAMDAVHEMLLQSWNATPGTNAPGVIRLFPATPWRWHEAAFDDLRAEGGHRVSARRENNATTWFRILAGSDGLVRIRDNFGGRTPDWSRSGVKKIGTNYELTLKAGEALEATLPKPKSIPPAPANVAEPVVIRRTSARTPDKLPSTPWSATQVSRLHRALESWHPRYDPAERMIRRPFSSPGYHTTLQGGDVHPTRDSLNYAVALLDTGDPGWLLRAEDILRRVLVLQDQDPDSKTYGIWSWFLEEPLDQMAPPDWNWADFCGVHLLQVALDHRHRLAPDLAAGVDAAIQHAARSIRRRNVGPGYTNIAIMGAYVTLVAAELYQLEDLREYARNRWRAFHAFTRRSGAFSEYNSPTYTVVALKELARMRQHVRDAEMRRLVEEVYRLAWEEVAHHFHSPTRQWAGPHSRAYHTLLPGDTLALIERSTEGRGSFGAGEPAPALDEHRVPTPCPRDLEPLFTALPAPREVVKTFVPGEPPVTGTTFLHPQFALGSINRGDLWNQRRALLAYWGTAEAPSYLHVRCLRDGYDFAAAQFFSVQRGGDLLAGVNFATDGGNTHVSLDRLQNATVRARDLRLRFEFGGTAGGKPLPMPARLDEPLTLRWGEVRLSLCVPYARFGDAVGRWETGHDAGKQTAWLDVVLYAGERTEIRLDQLEQAVAGLAVRFSDRDEAGPAVQGVVAEGRLALALESPGLRLTLPVRPGKAGALQTGFTVAAHP